MPDSDSRAAETVRRTFAPDPEAVDRVVAFALAPRRPRHRVPAWLAAGLGVLVLGALLWRARPHEETSTTAFLFNQGDIFVSRTAAGTLIHNHAEIPPRSETETFQIIVRGETP